jgi:hypothetical protein
LNFYTLNQKPNCFFIIRRFSCLPLNEKQYLEFAKEVVHVLNTHSFNLYRTIDLYAITITAQALTSNVTWPYVTISSFEVRGDFIEQLSRTSRVGFIPMISESNRWEWEAYTTNHSEWIHQGLLYDDVDLSLLPSLSSIPDHIYHNYIDSVTNTVTKREVSSSIMHFGNVDYAPIWQLSPVPQDLSIIKYDLFQNDDFRDTYGLMRQTGQAEISGIADVAFFLSSATTADSSHPHSFLLCPVYPYLRNRTRSSVHGNHEDHDNEGDEDSHGLEDTDGNEEEEDHESYVHDEVHGTDEHVQDDFHGTEEDHESHENDEVHGTDELVHDDVHGTEEDHESHENDEVHGADEHQFDSDDEYSNDPVGTVMAVFEWQNLLRNILPDGELPQCISCWVAKIIHIDYRIDSELFCSSPFLDIDRC